MTHSSLGTVPSAQVSVGHASQMDLMDIMVQLLAQMENLKTTKFRQREIVSGKTIPEEVKLYAIKGVVVCYRCGQEGHFTRG